MLGDSFRRALKTALFVTYRCSLFGASEILAVLQKICSKYSLYN